ncbi:DEAD/DEAH box helicase [Agaribacter flavus]|uniref:DEAD/DEAH box helicase n=1 Tax=Agaribacter flavus TaxID=1902781 RepID=A0ABV7FL19_9ALTE
MSRQETLYNEWINLPQSYKRAFSLLFSDLPLDFKLKKSIEIQGFNELTEVQTRAITKGLLGQDLMVASKTGSGKTLGFLVPAINRLLTQKPLSKRDPRVLVLAPTRELAKQVFMVAKKLIQNTRLSCALVVGGENFNTQAKYLKKNPDIVIGTAGRIADHIDAKHVFFNGLELLILDEADRMLELGFSSQLSLIHEQANHRKRQTMMFSATVDSAEMSRMTDNLLNSPEKIVIDKVSVPHTGIEQRFYLSDHVDHKDKQLLALLRLSARQQAIVFTATRDDTARIQTALNENGHNALFLHGELLQNQRNAVLNDFLNNKADVLVTTDLAARGLDIRNVALVINYDLPKHADEYIHRIGRTGRAGDNGIALSLVGKRDWWSFKAIQTRLMQSFKFSELEDFPARFKGLVSPKKQAQKPLIDKNQKCNKASEKTVGKAKIVRKKHEANAIDIGSMPMKKKRKAED